MNINDISALTATHVSSFVRGKLEAPTPAAPVEPPEAMPAPSPVERRKSLEEAVARVRAAVEAKARDLQFSIDQDSGRTVVKVVDSVTKEVVRQIPSEEMLAISRAIDKLQGLLLKQKV